MRLSLLPVALLIVAACDVTTTSDDPTTSTPDGSTSGGDAQSDAASNGGQDGGATDATFDAASGPAWTLVETKDFENLGPGATNYSVDFTRGRVAMRWSLGSDAWGILAQWSAPPSQISSADTVSLSTSLETTEDVGTSYSANGTFDVWFDRVTDVEPGGVGAPVDDPSITTDSVHFDIRHGTPMTKLTKVMTLPAKALGTAKPGDRIVLMVAVFNGRAVGTRYTYQWK